MFDRLARGVKKSIASVKHHILGTHLPWFRGYLEAKRIHESSPFGWPENGLYKELSEDDKLAAQSCPLLSRAVGLYRELLKLKVVDERPFNKGITHHQLGLVFHRQGLVEDARTEYEAALGLLVDLPDAEALPPVSTCHFRLGEIAMDEGNLTGARKHFERSIALDQQMRDEQGLRMNLFVLNELDKAR